MAGVPRGPSNFDPWQGWELSARNPFLPVGEYTNEAGDVSAGFAMPSIVSEPVSALARLLNTPAGTMPNPQNPEMQQDALTGLLSLYGGNAMSGMATLPKNAVGMFAGRRAKTADHAALARAEDLAASGADRNAIWNETGWFQGPDKQWRFEIDDSKTTIGHPGPTYERFDDYWYGQSANGKLGSILQDRSGLRPAYPAVDAEHTIITKGGSEGQRGYGRITAEAENAQDLRSILLHEKQHGIQEAEGFARGGSRSMFTPEEITAERARIGAVPEDTAGWSSVGSAAGDAPDTDVAHGLYKRLAGETEARNVQARMNMSADQRRATPPWETQDIPFEDQIVRLLSDTGKPSPVGSAIGSALDMSPEARLARAREQGFDTDRVWYHGTAGPLEGGVFSNEMLRSVNDNPLSGTGHFFSSHPAVAENYAEAASFGTDKGPNLVPVYVRPGKQKTVDYNGYSPAVHSVWEAVQPAKDAGYDSVVNRNQWNGNSLAVTGGPRDPSGIDALPTFHYDERSKPTNLGSYQDVKGSLPRRRLDDFSVIPDELVVFDPSNIRSVNAAFDPARAGENGLLLSDTGRPSIMGSAIASSAGEKAKGARPEPSALLPKAEAMGASLAETDLSKLAEEAYVKAYRADVDANKHRYFNDWADDPKNPIVADDWGRQIGGSEISESYDNATPFGNRSLLETHPAVANALSDAAAVIGRELYMVPSGSGSSYGQLRTPSGNSYKVRVADHANTSSLHDAPDFNIAPGALSPEEFINLLPTLLSDTGRPSIMGSAVASGEFDPYADVPPWLLGLDERVTY